MDLFFLKRSSAFLACRFYFLWNVQAMLYATGLKPEDLDKAQVLRFEFKGSR